MIEQTAKVVKTESRYAWLEAESTSSCGHCESKQGCGQFSLATFFKPRSALIKIEKGELDLTSGDRVGVGINEKVMLVSSLILYLAPLLYLLLFAIAGFQLTLFLESLFSTKLIITANFAAIVGGFLGFYLGYRVARRKADILAAKPGVRPVIIKRL